MIQPPVLTHKTVEESIGALEGAVPCRSRTDSSPGQSAQPMQLLACTDAVAIVASK